MKEVPVGKLSDISNVRKRNQGTTPRIRVAETGKGSLPGSTRWRNLYGCASPVVAVDPFDARGCRVCTGNLRNAPKATGVIPARFKRESGLRILDSGQTHPRRRIRGKSGVTSVFEIRYCSVTVLQLAVLRRSGSGEVNFTVLELHSQ